jgi:replication factor C subunit 1
MFSASSLPKADAQPMAINESSEEDDFIDDDEEEPRKSKAKKPPAKKAPVKKPAKSPKKPVKKEEPAEEDEEEEKPKAKKPKSVTSHTSTKADISFAAIQAARAAGPKNPGGKEIPQGQTDCLGGLTLVFTGELETLGRDEAVELAKRYGA